MSNDTPIFAGPGPKQELEEGLTFTPRFDADGLIPAIVTEAGSNDPLMFAFMNARRSAAQRRDGGCALL